MANTWTTLLDAVYPIGSVYSAYTSTSPATRFGGTWSAITGRFPYYNAGTGTGGSNEHTLTIDEMPSHTHPMELYGVNNSSTTGGWMGKYPVRINEDTNYNWPINWGLYFYSAGGSQAHNNMPAYQTLYAWRRTA